MSNNNMIPDKKCNAIRGCNQKAHIIIKEQEIFLCKTHKSYLLMHNNEVKSYELAYTKINADGKKLEELTQSLRSLYAGLLYKFRKEHKKLNKLMYTCKRILLLLAKNSEELKYKNRIFNYSDKHLFPKLSLDGFVYNIKDYCKQSKKTIIDIISDDSSIDSFIQFLKFIKLKHFTRNKCVRNKELGQTQRNNSFDFLSSYYSLVESVNNPRLKKIIQSKIFLFESWKSVPSYIKWFGKSKKTKEPYKRLFKEAHSYLRITEYRDSLRCFRAANRLKKSSKTLFYIGYVLFILGDYPQSIRVFQECIKDEKVSENTYRIAIKYTAYASAKLNQWKIALKLLNLAQKHGLRCFEVERQLCISTGQIPNALYYFAHLYFIEDNPVIDFFKHIYPYIEEACIQNMLDMCIVIIEIGLYEEAEKYLKQIVRKLKMKSMYVKPIMSESLRALALTLQKLGLYDEALENIQKCIDIDKRLYGRHHHRLLLSIGRKADILLDKRVIKEAERNLKKIHNYIYDKDPIYFEVNLIFGKYYQLKCYFLSAYRHYSIAMITNVMIFGKFHHTVAQASLRIGSLYSSIADSKAIKFYKVALSIYEIRFPGGHPEICVIYYMIKQFYEDAGLSKSARKYLKKIKTALEQFSSYRENFFKKI